MAGTRDIKRKIVSVKNTQKVTKAMKMVSAAKMRRAMEAMLATKPYADKIRQVTADVAGRINEEEVTLPLLKTSEEVNTIALLVMNSDRGLCGAFNSNVVKMAHRFQSEHPGKEIKLYTVGKNAYDHNRRRKANIVEKWVALGGRVSFESAKHVGDVITEAFLNDEFDELYVIYNEFRSVSYQIPKTVKLFPLALEIGGGEEQEILVDYIFEPEPIALLEELLPRYVNFTIYHYLLESAAGEHGARMVAMDNATRNADDMVKKLTLNYNKARQAAITKDLLDIVNGAEALKG